MWQGPSAHAADVVAHLGSRARWLRDPEVATVPVEAVGDRGIRDLVERVAGVLVTGVVDPAETARWAEAVESRPDLWDRRSSGPTVTVGAAWFAHAGVEPDPVVRARAYRDAAERGDAAVDVVAPGLHARLLDLTSRLLDAPVVRRPGWAGPGFVRFAPGADTDGDVHIDWIGLAAEDPAHLDRPCRSFVLMVRPGDEGGDLRLWPVGDGSDGPAVTTVPAPLEVRYPVGGLLVFDGHLLHQITALGGTTPRLTITWHAVRPRPDGPWELWF